MEPTILSRTISGNEEKRARLANSVFGRTISIGNSWTKIRIGVRASFENLGAAITGDPRLIIGVCAGLTNLYGDPTTDNFAGIFCGGTTWNWTNLPPAYYTVGNNVFPLKKVNTTVTVGSAITGNPGPAFSASPETGLCFTFFVDIQKGAPNYSFWVFWPNTAADVSQATFKTQMEAATPVITDYVYSGPQTLAVDEVAGNFDSVSIHWRHSAPAFEISDLAVCKLS